MAAPSGVGSIGAQPNSDQLLSQFHSFREGEQVMRIQTPAKTNVMKTFWQISFCLVLLFCYVATGHAQARHGMISSQYQSEFNNLTSQGYRLTYVSGYTVNDQERFAAIWEQKADPAWITHHGMTSAQYQSLFDQYTGQGYRLTLVNGYTVNGQDRYVAIWEQNAGPAWIAHHGMTSAQYQSAFNTYVRLGFRLIHVSGYAVRDQACYAAIWEQKVGPAWVARHGMTTAEYQNEFDNYVAQGFRLTHVSGYEVGGSDNYAAIWEKLSVPAWVARHRMTSGDYQAEFIDRFIQGYR